jgi:hypothetical protein
MWNYTYKHGDRPLDGYTIQRAAGRGGFGEVYYAISDAGREVALKVITGFEQIELRGISQCMNLKSPHLVSIFDVKFNEQGRAFVIMEFVAGPNLRELLDESPAGLGTQKAAFFLREIGKGLSYLHDCGIVHRDLKPANIFFENGYAKIGDYGLSKAIAPTHHSGQTVTVGTVHYMAPEVGAGKYDRSIDIYALGALLYEMLTGMVPFIGASAGEILIKHLSHEPDVSGIAEPFASAIRRAMAKDPAHRFQTVQEMVEAVFGAEHVRHSVAAFSPQDLSMVAGRVAARMAPAAPRTGGGGSGGGGVAAGSSVTNPRGLGAAGSSWAAATEGTDRARGKASCADWMWSPRKTAQRIKGTFLDYAGPATEPPPLPDSIRFRQRLFLAVVATIVVAWAAQLFIHAGDSFGSFLVTALAIAGTSTGILYSGRNWFPWAKLNGEWADRFSLAATGALSGLIWSAFILFNMPGGRSTPGGMLIGLIVGLAVADPREWIRHDRAERIRFKSAVWAGFMGFVAGAIFGGNGALLMAIAGGTALVVQVLASWDELAATRRAAAEEGEDDQAEDEDPAAAAAAAADAPTQPGWAGAGVAPVAAMPVGAASPWPAGAVAGNPNASPAARRRLVPRWLSILWVCLLPFLLAMGVALNVAGADSRGSDAAALHAVGVSMFLAAGFCFMRMWEKSFISWWSYLGIPLLRMACLVGAVACGLMLAETRSNSDEQAVLIFFVVFCGALWLMLWMVPSSWRHYGDAATWTGITPERVPGPPPVVAGLGAISPPAPPPPPSTVQSATRQAMATARQAMNDAVASARLARANQRLAAARRRRGDSDFLGGAAGFAATLLVLAALLLSVALAIDVPGMLAAGLPDPRIGNELARDVFAGSVNWPTLMRGMMWAAVSLLLSIGVTGVIFSRRRGGGAHMIRGVVGVLGVLLSLYPIFLAVTHSRLWTAVAHRKAQVISDAAMEAVLQRLAPAGIAAFVIVVVSSIVLFWPARRGQVKPKGARV